MARQKPRSAVPDLHDYVDAPAVGYRDFDIAAGSSEVDGGYGRVDAQFFQQHLQEQCTLSVTRGRIQQIPDNARQSEFIFSQVSQRIEPVREVAVQFAIKLARRLQSRLQFVEEASVALAIPGPSLLQSLLPGT